MARTALLFNPLEPGFAEDPYPAYRRLRHADPVHKSSFGIWLLSQYEDVSAILRSQLSVDMRQVKARHLVEEYNQGDRGGRVPSMLDRDPPDHTRLRSLVTKVFTPRAIAALESLITGLVDAALDRIAEAGHADLVEALAFPLPFEVISRMLGVPPTDTARVRELSGTIVRSLDVVTEPEILKAIGEAAEEFDVFAAEMIHVETREPGRRPSQRAHSRGRSGGQAQRRGTGFPGRVAVHRGP